MPLSDSIPFLEFTFTFADLVGSWVNYGQLIHSTDPTDSPLNCQMSDFSERTQR